MKYRVIKENALTGKRAKQSKIIEWEGPLIINTLYAFPHLKGLYRVLEQITERR